ncbi:MAG: TonB family protein [Puniceicoccaceae bacterium]|nr:MAG: TonB family protein [Puniceicoccaceae bacterium]
MTTPPVYSLAVALLAAACVNPAPAETADTGTARELLLPEPEVLKRMEAGELSPVGRFLFLPGESGPPAEDEWHYYRSLVWSGNFGIYRAPPPDMEGQWHHNEIEFYFGHRSGRRLIRDQEQEIDLGRWWGRDELQRGRIFYFVLRDGEIRWYGSLNARQLLGSGIVRKLSLPVGPETRKIQVAICLVDTSTHRLIPPQAEAVARARAIAAIAMGRPAWLETELAGRDLRDGGFQMELLRQAVRSNEPGIFESLLERGFTPSRRSAPSLVEMAASIGRSEIAQRALEAGATRIGDEALHLAISYGHDAVVEQLLESGVDIQRRGEDGYTPVYMALNYNRSRWFEELLARGARFDWRDRQLVEMLVTRVWQGQSRIVDRLLAGGLNANLVRDGASLLMVAARHGDWTTAEVLLRHGAEVELGVANGSSPLVVAALEGHAEVVEVLLRGGARVDQRFPQGLSLLHLTTSRGHAKVVDRLLAHGLPMDQADDLGLTALDHALIYGLPEVSQVLIDRGSRIKVSSPLAETLLLAALRDDLVELVELAIEDGFPRDHRFHEHWSLADAAVLYGAEACRRWIEETLGVTPAEGGRLTTPIRDLDERPRLVASPPVDDPRPGETEPRVEVRVRTMVDDEGMTRFAKVLGETAPVLVGAALNLVEGMRFQPLTANGAPARAMVTIPVVFPERTSEILRADEVDTPPQARHQPDLSVRPGLYEAVGRGEVQATFTITETGSVENVRIRFSTHPELARAAMETFPKWFYRPAMQQGRPVAVQLTLTLSVDYTR